MSGEVQKKLGWVVIFLAALAFVAMVVFACLAIWTVGPDSNRWTSMGGLSGAVTFILAIVGAAAVADL